MWLKILFLGCLLLCCLLPCFSQDTSTTSSLTDIEQLKELFLSILTYTDASQEDFLTLNSLFSSLESEISSLPKLQLMASELLKKNGELSRDNFWLRVGLFSAAVLITTETGYLIYKSIVKQKQGPIGPYFANRSVYYFQILYTIKLSKS